MSNFTNAHYYIPRLSKIDPDNIKGKLETPESIGKLLEPCKKLNLDDTPLSDCGSEISDAFADLHAGMVLSHAKGEPSIPKSEADWLVMQRFTDEFKEAIKEVRKEMKLGDNMMLEDPEDIMKILKEEREPKELPKLTQNRIDELLRDKEHICLTPSQLADDQAERKGSNATSNTISEVWEMLETHNASREFKISSPNFNVFHEQEPHWLNKPHIPWDAMNLSKLKCEKWLEEQDDH